MPQSRIDGRLRSGGTAGLLLLLAACAGHGSTQPSPSPSGEMPASGQVTVLAASSLTDVMDELATRFEAAHPDADVALSLAGSATLAAQVRRGAPADVLVTASAETMTPLAEAGLVAGGLEIVARNVPAIAVPAGNPGGVESLADLAQNEAVVALCAPSVPCGAVTQEAFARAGLTPSADTLEQDVRAVLTKVVLGEVDAGVVYATDVRSAGDEVEGISIPDAGELATPYPVAVLRDAPNPVAAQAFRDFLLSDAAGEVLRAAGFGVP